MIKLTKNREGFTLIELLLTIVIIGILLSFGISSYSKLQKQSRDARRKADLELIRSGLEMYRADCNAYPLTLGASLVGSGSGSCSASNVYIANIPTDSFSDRNYSYASLGTNYILCAALEVAPSPALDTSGCATCTVNCNYKTVNP